MIAERTRIVLVKNRQCIEKALDKIVLL